MKNKEHIFFKKESLLKRVYLSSLSLKRDRIGEQKK
jgi:hypothetical protein